MADQHAVLDPEEVAMNAQGEGDAADYLRSVLEQALDMGAQCEKLPLFLHRKGSLVEMGAAYQAL